MAGVPDVAGSAFGVAAQPMSRWMPALSPIARGAGALALATGGCGREIAQVGGGGGEALGVFLGVAFILGLVGSGAYLATRNRTSPPPIPEHMRSFDGVSAPRANNTIDIERGFQLETPEVFVPWDITEKDLANLLGRSLRRTAHGHYVISCISLGGMKHELGFHFDSDGDGRLKSLTFFRKKYASTRESYDDFQRRFEEAFGAPSSSAASKGENSDDLGFPCHTWRFNGVKIRHHIFERFGPEEHMVIQRDPPRRASPKA